MMLLLYINTLSNRRTCNGATNLGLSFQNYDLRQNSKQSFDVGFMENKVALIQASLRILHISLASSILSWFSLPFNLPVTDTV